MRWALAVRREPVPKTYRNHGRAVPWGQALLIVALLVALGGGAAPAAGQDEVPAAGPPQSLSARLISQGHDVTPDEAVYLDADEQVTEQYVRLLVVVEELARMNPTAPNWRTAIVTYLQAMTDLDPAEAPVPPPDSLAEIHARSVAYRAELGTAAQAWLDGVEVDDPTWLLRGNDAYAAAERARLQWYQALYEYYTGEPAPNALPDD
ncbi:MAG TPA: hypothetical protein VII06_37485 [Chloroflexota bacterium]